MAQQNDHLDRGEALAKINALIKGIRIAMFTSVDEHGELHARPMGTQQVEFDGTLWFFTQRSTEKVDEFRHNPNVNVAYSDPDKQRYVSVAGKATLVDDDAKKKELWQPALKAWFPDGLDDPQLALIRVDVEGAEYWDQPSGKIVAVYGMVKAAITGKPANDVGENKTVDLR